MLQALYTGGNGMLTHQQNIDVIANNVANMSTPGYKSARMDFRDALYERMRSPTDNSPGVNLQRGAGVLPYQTVRDFTTGTLTDTGRPLDFVVEGEGFFLVEGQNGERLYTRAGTFYLSAETTGDYLVDASGMYVLDANQNRVRMQGNVSDLSVGPDGTLSTLNPATQEITAFARLGVFGFDNPNGLTTVGANYFVSSDNSGAPRAAAGTVRQGVTEASNVDYAMEVTRLIRAQRAYQLSARLVTTADQMAQTCNSIRT